MGVVNPEKLSIDMAFHARMTSGQAEDAIRVFGELVTRAVADGHTVELPAFGKFELGKRGNGEPALRFVQSNSVRKALKS